MTNPNVDAAEMGDRFKEFLDECAADSDMDEEGDLPEDEKEALVLLQDLDIQAKLLHEFEQFKNGEASADDVIDVVKADNGPIDDKSAVAADSATIDTIVSSEGLEAVPADDAELVSKLALGGHASVCCRSLSFAAYRVYRIVHCIVCIICHRDRLVRAVIALRDLSFCKLP